ncbi:MAG: hypothetical protein ANABAC_3619 [Anaerolineae bacterium]|nr:MAG: hypothetical protein ANABAC_3619 [Anaerolineae bacterium]
MLKPAMANKGNLSQDMDEFLPCRAWIFHYNSTYVEIFM